MTIPAKKQKEFRTYNEATVVMTALKLMLFILDKFALKSLYQHKVKAAGNHLRSTLESMSTSIFLGNIHTGFVKDPESKSAQQYADVTDYLLVQCSIYTAIKSQPEEKAFEFFNDLEDVYIKHGLLQKKGDMLKSDVDHEEVVRGLGEVTSS
jgi:hypothetical protein